MLFTWNNGEIDRLQRGVTSSLLTKTSYMIGEQFSNESEPTQYKGPRYLQRPQHLTPVPPTPITQLWLRGYKHSVAGVDSTANGAFWLHKRSQLLTACT